MVAVFYPKYSSLLIFMHKLSILWDIDRVTDPAWRQRQDNMGGREQVESGFGSQLLQSENNSVNDHGASETCLCLTYFEIQSQQETVIYIQHRRHSQCLRGMGQISALLTHKCLSDLLKQIAFHFFPRAAIFHCSPDHE